MPLYEYECEACGRRFEVIRKFSDPLIETCELCGAGPVRRLLSSPAIQFKGAGWYVTDYARSGSPDKDQASKAPKSEGSKSDGSKSDAAGATTDAKPAPPPAPKADAKD